MPDHRACSGDASCTDCDAVAVDTSHLGFLARVARQLEPDDPHRRSQVFFSLVRASACWRTDRLLTADSVYELQIDPRGERCIVLEILGTESVPSGADWSECIGSLADDQVHELQPLANKIHQGGGDADCSLLAHTACQALQGGIYLVLNDERMHLSAEHLSSRLAGEGLLERGVLVVRNSAVFMRSLLDCGAITRHVMSAALVAEYTEVERREEMSLQTKRRKRGRLIRMARELAITLEQDDPPPFDDSDIAAEFLRKAEENGP